MDDNRLKQSGPLDRISELLEDELVQATGIELEEIARRWGIDPAKSVEAVDSAFKEALRQHNKAKLRAALSVRDAEIAKLATIQQDLPKDRDSLVALLTARLVAMRQDDPSRVTIQHRNLGEFTEDDLRGLLRDLCAVDNP